MTERNSANRSSTDRPSAAVLTAIYDTTRTLMRTGSSEELYRMAIDCAEDPLSIPFVAAYSFDPMTGALDYVASTTETAELFDPDDRYERGDGPVWDAFSTGESITVHTGPANASTGTTTADSMAVTDENGEQSSPRGVEANDAGTQTRVPHSRRELIVPLGNHGVLIVGDDERSPLDETARRLVDILAATLEAALDRAEHEQLLREHDRELTRKNEELTRLNHTNDVVREINRGIAQASTRDEIESAVCDGLAGTERYRFAVIVSADTDPSEPTTWAGVDASFVDRVWSGADSPPELEFVRETIEQNMVGVVHNVLEADGWDDRRTDALTYGYQTMLSVPFGTTEYTHGVVLIYAGHVDEVGDRERTVLGELGDIVGYAIQSVDRTRAMVTDRWIELELESPDEQLLLNRLSERLGRTVTLEGHLDREDALVLFCRVHDDGDGADGSDTTATDESADDEAPALEQLHRLAEDWASIERVSMISQTEQSTLLEVTASDSPLFDRLQASDARLVTATSSAGLARLVLSIPGDVDARSVIESIQTPYPETQLRARRETETKRPTGGFREQLASVVTERQFEALQAAYYSGFFEWPRESTGADLADTLDVAPPTYHYHLRAAERALVDLVFDDAN